MKTLLLLFDFWKGVKKLYIVFIRYFLTKYVFGITFLKSSPRIITQKSCILSSLCVKPYRKDPKKRCVVRACARTRENEQTERSFFVFCGVYDCMLFCQVLFVCVCVYAYVCMYACMRMCA